MILCGELLLLLLSLRWSLEHVDMFMEEILSNIVAVDLFSMEI